MKNFKTFSSILAMLICFVAMAQDQIVFGVVSDASGPLAGVMVTVKTQQWVFKPILMENTESKQKKTMCFDLLTSE
jgi:hypothetical protein